MQMHSLSTEQLATVLESSRVLSIVDEGSLRTYVLTHEETDILIHTSMGDRHVVVYPCHAFDAESGGSVHDHARAAFDA